MTRQDDGPVTPQGGNDPATATATAPVTTGAVMPMRRAERAGAVTRRAGSAITAAVHELWLHPDRLLYVLWHGKPESMAEHRAYMQSRAWVPPEMTGGPEKAVIGAGLFYHLLIARPLKAAAKTVDAAADRPLRLLCLAVFVTVLIVLLARY